MKTTIYAPGREVYVVSPGKLTKTFIDYAIIHETEVTYFDDKGRGIKGEPTMYDSVDDFYRGVESRTVDVEKLDCYLKGKMILNRFNMPYDTYFCYHGHKYKNGDVVGTSKNECYRAKIVSKEVGGQTCYELHILDAGNDVYPTRKMALNNIRIEIVDNMLDANEVVILSDDYQQQKKQKDDL